MTVEELEIIIKANIKDALKGIKEVTEAVRQCVADSIKPIQQISQQTKQVVSSNANNIKNMKQQMNSYLDTTKSTTAQEELLIKKIQEKYSLLQKLQNTKPVQLEDGRIATTNQKQLEVRAEIEKLENQLHKLQGTTEKTTEKSKFSFEKLWSSLKKGTLLLLGARSAFLLLRAGMQSAVQADEALQAQQSITSNAIGQLFVPAMKVALDAVQYLVIGIALLIKMFTGYDALAKVTTKNIQKTAGETKKLNKELTAMDEITNLNGESTGLGVASGLQADLNALDEFNKKIEEVQKLFDSWGIQKIVDKLKGLWEWIKDNKDMLIQLGIEMATIFGIAKIGEWVMNLKKLKTNISNVSTTAGGLSFVLENLLTLGIITVTIAIAIQGLKEFNKFIDRVNEYGLKSTLVMSYSERQNKLTSGSFIERVWANMKKMVGLPFANGGVLTKPTYGLMAEYPGASTNPEIISPQNIMYDTMLDAFGTILPSLQSQNQNGDVILNVNGKELARATFQDYKNEEKRLGSSTAIRRV